MNAAAMLSLPSITLGADKLTIVPHRCGCTVLGQHVTLTTSEFRLLYLLAKQVNRIVTYEEIASQLGVRGTKSQQNIASMVKRLRKALFPDDM